MSASVQLPGSAAYLLKVAALAAVYYATARLGLRYASIGQSISLVWPLTGIALAALVILGRSSWPGVSIGAFLANAATAVPLAATAGIAAGKPLEAVLAASLLLAPGTPVLFTSGYTDGEILRRGLLEPGVDFLPKPFSPEALARAVRLRTAANR